MFGSTKRSARVRGAESAGSEQHASQFVFGGSGPAPTAAAAAAAVGLTTPNYLREQATHALTNGQGANSRTTKRRCGFQALRASFGRCTPAMSDEAGREPSSHAARQLIMCVDLCFTLLPFVSGVKSAITFILFSILLFSLWRHETRPRRAAPAVTAVETPTPSIPVPHARPAHHADTSILLRAASAVPVAAAAPKHPLGPSHVHPTSFEWTHESAVSERRPPNFALNGEHAQYNEEKLTALFDRPRVAGLQTPGLVTSFVSPSGRLKLSVLMSEEGRIGYSIDVARPDTIGSGNVVYLPLISPSFTELNANYQSCAFNTANTFGAEVFWQLEFGESWWRPVPGNERRHFHETYQQAKVWCVGPQCLGCDFLWEYRLYDHAFAVRAVIDGKSIDGFPLQPQADTEAEYSRLDFGMEVRLPQDANTLCWAQNSEDPYVKKTCLEFQEPVMTPITVVLDPKPASELPPKTKPPALPYRYISILQADGPTFMRSMGQTFGESVGNGTQPNTLSIITKGELPIHAQEHQPGVIEHPILGWSTPTSWNVVLVADSPQELVHHNSIIYLLCPPPDSRFPMAMDGRWVAHGKSLRVRGHTTQKSKQLVDLAFTFNYQMVHFDAGWYGDENNRSSDAREIAKEFAKDLDIADVAKYGRTRGIGVSVYVNEIALKDTLDLIEVYPRWNLHAIKFGFVDVWTPRAMRILHQRMVAYQHVGMMVNIHDIYRPRGLSRTWPHLVTQEGVRGEERKPDATHHTILPFVRYLQGAADYTPRYLKGALRCTRAHQLALPMLLFSPVQSLFWAEPGQAIAEAIQLYHPELIIWQMMPTTWDDTRVLAGSIGEYGSFARRAGRDWFIGSITNTEARELTLNLSTLFDHTIDAYSHPLPILEAPADAPGGYMVHLYEDDHSYEGDLTVEANLNDVKVRRRQSFILPAAFSTNVDEATRARALSVSLANGGSSVFPSDPVPGHVSHLQEYRRKAMTTHEKKLANALKKEGRTLPEPTTLTSPIFTINMAPSGGSVLFLTPIR